MEFTNRTQAALDKGLSGIIAYFRDVVVKARVRDPCGNRSRRRPKPTSLSLRLPSDKA